MPEISTPEKNIMDPSQPNWWSIQNESLNVFENSCSIPSLNPFNS
jgi:hypothetical protein